MTPATSTARAYLQLFRVPNLFTALADVTMGFLFVHAGLRPVGVYVCLAAASACLYTAGMVLNDVWDVEQDRRERPARPIASGRIGLSRARRVGFALLLSGVLCGWAAGYLVPDAVAMPMRSGLVATLLAVLVVLYDALLKRTWLGPLAMGACRALNVLLGMAVAQKTSESFGVASQAVWGGFPSAQLLSAGGIGLYIVGVTWFARHEAAVSRRWQLAMATMVMGVGIAVLGLVYPALPAEMPRSLHSESTWLLLLGLLAFVIIRRCTLAVADPAPQRVQSAVKNAIWSLIMLDAAVALLVAHPIWSLAIVALLLPTLILGSWFPAT